MLFSFHFFHFPAIFILLVVLFCIFGGCSRRRAGRFGQRLCSSCGAAHPGFARFCRRCGQKLGN